jgi:SAM-dependent methyltransferase
VRRWTNSGARHAGRAVFTEYRHLSQELIDMSRKRKSKKRPSADDKRRAAERKAERRWNRPWQPAPGTPDVVSRYLKDVGMIPPLPEPSFRESLRHRFGEQARDYLEVSREDAAAIHATAAASPALAMAIESEFSGDRCQAYLSWLVETELPPPKKIVDVGCGIGTNACFCARHFPQATVIGIDRCEASISCATQLAAKLGLENVEFQVADARNLPEHLTGQRFDIVLSSFAVHEAVGLRGKPARTLEETYAQPVDPQLVAYATMLSDFLEDAGVLIMFERVHSLTELAKWALALQVAGVGIDWEGTEFLSFVEHHGDPALDVPVLRGAKRRSAMIDPDGLRAIWINHMCDPEICGAEGDAAEAVFAALHPKTLVKGLRIGKDDREMRYELWRHGSLAIVYRYELGRCLVLAPQQHGPQLFDLLDPRKGKDASNWTDVRIEEYSSPEEADGEGP